MTIYGLDISLYQEYDWKLIDWPKLKADPYNFRFIWIKCQEGSYRPEDAGSYDIDIVKRQVAGAKSVGFEAINLYHYYWYQYMNTAGNWIVIKALDQATAFYATYLASGLDIAHPMTDCEDPLIDQFLRWSDTATINAAIAFARRLNKHLEEYHRLITELFGVQPDIYTGKWWLDKFVPLLINNGYANEVAWLKDYRFILADYDGTLNIPDYIGEVIAWQETSTPNPPVQGIPTGHYVAGDALDIDRWMLSEEEFNEWSGGTMTESGIYKQTVKNIDKATFVVFSDEDKQVDMSAVTSDLVMLKMVGQDTGGMLVHEDTAFKIRAGRATDKPVIGWINLDADLFWNKEITLPVLQNRTMYDNETIKAILKQWRVNPFTDTEWNNRSLNISADDGGWVKTSGLVFFMFRNYYSKGGAVNGMWQVAILVDQLKVLTSLMEGGYIPRVPMYLVAGVDFYRFYATDPTWNTLKNNSMLTGIGVIETGKPGLFTEVPMATPFDTLEEVFSFRPADNYSVTYVPDGFNAQFDIYSGNRFRALPFGNVLLVGLWCDTKDELYKFLNFSTEIIVPSSSPSPSTIPVDEELVERVEIIETRIDALISIINALNSKLEGVITWKNTPL